MGGAYASLRDTLLGEIIGGCRIDASLGGGAMGFVFKAHHLALDKYVAVKVLTPDHHDNPELKRKFRNEARIASAIEHSNIPPIYGVGEDRGYSYIIMRYFDGASLYRALSRQGMDPLLACKIGENVALALAAVHREGYVHRDVKPENILLTDRGAAVLTDFGVAGEVGAADPPGRGGSPAYMSPEQCRGDPVDGRSDVYSLGVTLYQMLTGRRPFLGSTRPSLMLMHQQDDFPSVLSLRPGSPVDLARAVERMLDKSPARRFQRAEDVVDAMRNSQEELRAMRRRDSMTVQKRGVRSAESGFFTPVSGTPVEEERDTEEIQLEGEAEDVELSLLSLETMTESGRGTEYDNEQSKRAARSAREAFAKSKYEAALARMGKALNLRPDDANLYVTRGNIVRVMKDREAAEADYRKALELSPDNRRALTALGSLLGAAGKAREAESLLRRALALDVGNVEARIALGKIYEKAGAIGLARKQYQKAIESVPADERGYAALAALQIGQGQHGAAKGLLGSARELNPTFAPTLFWLAVVFANEGNDLGALDMLEAAVKAGLKDRVKLQERKEFDKLREHYRFKALLGMFGL